MTEFGASVSLVNSTVKDNTEDGVRLRRGAVGEIGAGIFGLVPNIIAGNGQADLACDTTALVVLVGDPTGIST